MKSLILHNIISNNTVYKLNTFVEDNISKLGNLEVWFCSETESNRKWSLQEKIKFSYQILDSKKIELRGKDLFTYFINWRIWRKLNRYNPDKIIISGWDQFAYQLAFLWGWKNGKEIILWSGSTKYEKSWKRTLTRPLVKFFVGISSNYIAYGQRAKEYLISLGARKEKIRIFLNDVNKTYFQKEVKKFKKKKQKIKKDLNVSSEKFFIYVGQLIERKGILDLLEAYKIYKKRGGEAGLLIVGYGKLEKNIKIFIRNNDLQDIKLLGFVDQYDLPRYYAISDCLILPSHEEVWGLVVNEAYYSGLKIIASDKCGCVPQARKWGAKVFKSGNVRELKKLMSD
jgi:glycosyltransferase involved in cell wall biosynthesis